MKSKTSVTLSQELLEAIDTTAGSGVNRSEFLEKAGWDRVALLQRRQREARDRAILQKHVTAINEEALDTLDYQIEP